VKIKIKKSKLNYFPLSYIDSGQKFIYFLYLNNELVYIGKTNNVMSRVSQHKNDKKFNKIYFRSINHKFNIHNLEECLIYLIRPKYNRISPRLKSLNKYWTKIKMKQFIHKYFPQ